MKELQDIELKSLEEKNFNTNNEKNYSKQPNILNNKNTRANILFSSTQDFSSGDTLYGNNYIKYYLNNKFLSSRESPNLRPKKMGNLHVFFFINEEPIFAVGNISLNLVVLYELLLHISFIIIMKTIIKNLFLYMEVMLISFYLMCFIGHMYIYLINPGIPNIKYYSKTFIKSENFIEMKDEEKKGYYLCEICNIIVNVKDGIEHCDECGICVKNYDHHCYWTGKCIAKNNIWAFTLFTFGTLLYYVWYFILIIYWIILKIAHYSSIKANN